MPPLSDIPDTAGTRDRLVGAMASALQRRGYHGIGLSEVLAAAQAPKGVLYHHFPGGKAALAVAAIEATAARIAQALDQLIERKDDPVAALRSWLMGAQKMLEASGFERGCPLATVALESTADDVEIRAALAAGFALLRGHLAQALTRGGLSPVRGRQMAALFVSAFEGALMQARVAGNVEPMAETTQALLALLPQAFDRAGDSR